MKLFTAAIVLVMTFFGVNASFEKIAGYEPGSAVTDHNALDQDQAALQAELGFATAIGYNNAKMIYTEGGNSKSYAEVSLSTPLMADVSKGTAIKGTAVDGSVADGKAYSSYSAGVSTIKIQYVTSDVQASHVKCKVGALTTTMTDGCLEASGTMDIGGTSYGYSYDVDVDNNNGRTIQGFSTGAKTKMHECSNGCPYDEPKIYFKYFGDFDYADKWVTAALAGENVEFSSGKGNAMFKDAGYTMAAGLKEAVKKGTVYLNIYMYVIREYYDAIGDCEDACATCNDDAVHAWDEGVAFYTGSLEGQEGDGSSKMLFELAEKRCKNFGTCGENGDSAEGEAMVNQKIFSHLDKGKEFLNEGDCVAVKPILKEIMSQMTVPLVQGTLRYAYRQQKEDSEREKKNAEGVTFMTAILPKVDACNSDAAAILYDEMKASNTYTKDFTKVKAALESVYECMGITCDDVGGLLNGEGSYYEGMEPCGSYQSDSYQSDSSSVSRSLISTLTVTTGVLAMFSM